MVMLHDCRYVAWICFASLYHLPSFQSMGVDMRMNLSLFLTIYFSSVLFIIAFHIIFIGLWYIGLVARMAGTRPGIWTIVQNCTVSFVKCLFQICPVHFAPMKIDLLYLFQVISIACCVFYSHCGNLAVHKSKSFGSSSDPNLLAFLENENGSTWISNYLRMNQLKDQICSSWFAPVGSASDYPMLAKWVIYGEVPLASPLFIHFILILFYSNIHAALLWSCFSPVSLQWILCWPIRWDISFVLIVGYICWTLHC